MAETVAPDVEDLQNLLIGAAIVGVAFTAFSGLFTVDNLVFYVVAGLVVMVLREAGQRTVAHWMESYVDLEVSRQGAMTTLIAAGFSVISDFNLLLLFPVFSEFSGERYEQWGKSIDAMWMKRQYWLASSGIMGLWAGWILAVTLSMNNMAQAISIFAIFQLLPFDYETIPTGELDGATILRWSGFAWLLMMGFSILMLVVSL